MPKKKKSGNWQRDCPGKERKKKGKRKGGNAVARKRKRKKKKSKKQGGESGNWQRDQSLLAKYCKKLSLFVICVLFKLIWENEKRSEVR